MGINSLLEMGQKFTNGHGPSAPARDWKADYERRKKKKRQHHMVGRRWSEQQRRRFKATMKKVWKAKKAEEKAAEK